MKPISLTIGQRSIIKYLKDGTFIGEMIVTESGNPLCWNQTKTQMKIDDRFVVDFLAASRCVCVGTSAGLHLVLLDGRLCVEHFHKSKSNSGQLLLPRWERFQVMASAYFHYFTTLLRRPFSPHR